MLKPDWFVLCLAYLCAVKQCVGKAQSMSGTTNASDVTLRVEVLNPTFEEKEDAPTALLGGQLKLTFVNNGKRPVLLLKQNSPVCPGVTLTKTYGPPERDSILLDEYRGPGYSTSAEWSALRSALDQPKPPSKITQISILERAGGLPASS